MIDYSVKFITTVICEVHSLILLKFS